MHLFSPKALAGSKAHASSRFVAALSLLLSLVASAKAQLAPIAAFPLDSNPLVIRRPAMAHQPFSVTGERGAILGEQDGSFELWLLPVKLLHNARLTARLQGYDALIDLNAQAAQVEVRPDHTTITYAHAAITVRQHMFIPRTSEPGLTNAVVLFEVHAVRPAELTLSFEPSLERMWPAPNFGRPSGSWTAMDTGGAYTLETDNPALFGVVAMPNAQPGAIRPYQERPQTAPLEFHFHYDPAHDDASFYPLLCGLSTGAAGGAPARAELLRRVVAQSSSIARAYRDSAAYFNHFFDTRLTVTTPDPRFDEAMRWAELAIESNEVASPSGAGLAGGWFTSGDSARPGFGWFFGRDTLWTLYAVNSYGNFALSREAMDFLFAHQRADGKMMHEYSQTAETVDWAHLPYLYASADSTPLAVMQMDDYVRASGDRAFLEQHWDAIRRAFRFTRDHTTDGIYDNTQGTGWVEEWLPRLPHQEIYLAALDAQSSEAMARLATLMGDSTLVREATAAAASIRAKLPDFRDAATGAYAFSRNADGSFEKVASIFPAVAFWSHDSALPDAGPTLSAWAGHGFSTDWGTRSVPPSASIYDPISYHHGSVWPLYTGWASLAEFHAGLPLSGYAHLLANVELTWRSDPGAVTEVLSGEFNEPLGRSSSHQLWSSAMVLSPTLRGLFGLEPDALHHTLTIAPQLPPQWDRAELHNVPVGHERYTIMLRRQGSVLLADATGATSTVLCLKGPQTSAKPADCAERPSPRHHLTLPLLPVEVGLEEAQPETGARTTQMKIVSQQTAARSLSLTVEAPAGSLHHLFLRRNDASIRLAQTVGATLKDDQLAVSFDGSGETGWVTKQLHLEW